MLQHQVTSLLAQTPSGYAGLVVNHLDGKVLMTLEVFTDAEGKGQRKITWYPGLHHRFGTEGRVDEQTCPETGSAADLIAKFQQTYPGCEISEGEQASNWDLAD